MDLLTTFLGKTLGLTAKFDSRVFEIILGLFENFDSWELRDSLALSLMTANSNSVSLKLLSARLDPRNFLECNIWGIFRIKIWLRIS
jgi:hypothetical protein